MILLQIHPAELRHALRADALGLALGFLLLAAGLLTTAFAARPRRREGSLLWLGIFALLYGARLLARAGTVQFASGIPADAWNRLAAAITYVIPVPAALFGRAALPPRFRRRLGAVAAALFAFAIYGVVSDARAHRAYSAALPNNIIAICFLLAVLGLVMRPRARRSPELRLLRLGVGAATLAALADNLRGIHLISFRGPDLEPLGFTALVAALGTLAVRRVLMDGRRLVAIERELGIARQIQTSILPGETPRVHGVDVAARYRPMTAVAGDFYDFLPGGPAQLGVLVADVSGHGVPAALIASMVKVALAAQQDRAGRPAAVLSGMNDALCGRLGGQYVTAAYLYIDVAAGLVRYAAAGHPPLLRAARAGAPVQEVQQNGLPLGLMEVSPYEETESALVGGERFLLYTDGLIEAANDADDEFGLERVKATIAAGIGRSSEAALDSLLGAMDAWSGRPARDDVTLVLVDCPLASG
jgi:sigma-B regulation protein RsbU (phosphoserine phosphatase)